MKKVVFLLSFLAFALADDNEWLNQWSPSTAPKATQSGVKSEAYYKQNKGEARKVVQECEQKLLEVMEQLNANELKKVLTGDEVEIGIIMLKKLGATFVMNCDNAEKALGVNLFDDKVKSVAYYRQNKGEAKMVLQKCEQKLLEFMEQLSENEVEAIARGGEAAAAGIVLKKLGVIFAMDCDNAEKALGAELFE